MSTVVPIRASEDIRDVVAGEVRAWMGRRGVNQTALAAAIGVSQSQISKRLKGTIPFDIVELARVAAFLNVDVALLVGGAANGAGPNGGGSMATRGYTYPNAA